MGRGVVIRIARRYFRGRGFLSFIQTMAVGGVAVGSAGLLIALSVVHGFRSVIEQKTLQFAPHVTVTAPFSDQIHRADTLTAWLVDVDGVAAASAMVRTEVMVQHAGRITGGVLQGIPGEDAALDLSGFIRFGSWNLGVDGQGGRDGRDGEVRRESADGGPVRRLPGMVMGTGLAEELQAEVGDVLTVFAMQGTPSVRNLPEIRQFRLTGIYGTGIQPFDEGVLFAELDPVRALTGRGATSADRVDVRVGGVSGSGDAGERIAAMQERLQEELGFPYVVESIYQSNRNLFEWIRLQEQTIPFVISIMVVIAAFNLIGTVLMMVLERVQDIGVLKTMGMDAGAIRRVFLLEGLFVAGAGLGVGGAVFGAFYWIQSRFGVIRLSEENYYMSVAPVEPHALDFVLVAAVTVALCLAASLLPANVAAKTDPVRTLTFNT